MRRKKQKPRAPIQFSTLNPENIIVIELQGRKTVLRAARANFSPRRKAFLIRQLAAEGYIPDEYQYVTDELWDANLMWVVDRSVGLLGIQARRRAHRAMLRLIMAGCALWLLELALLFLGVR